MDRTNRQQEPLVALNHFFYRETTHPPEFKSAIKYLGSTCSYQIIQECSMPTGVHQYNTGLQFSHTQNILPFTLHDSHTTSIKRFRSLLREPHQLRWRSRRSGSSM
jgi:hypothetical protein